MTDRLAPEPEAQEAMRYISTAHLSSAVIERLLEDETTTAATAALPHLSQCSWCRNTLREALRLSEIETNHVVYTLLKEADNLARWDTAGRAATAEARRFLGEQGGRFVYGRDGVIYAENPGGTVETVPSPVPGPNFR